MRKNKTLVMTLKSHKSHFANVLPAHFQRGKIKVLHMTRDENDLAGVDIHSTESLIAHSEMMRRNADADMLIGSYLEDRNIYKRSPLFDGAQEDRTIHLGIDLMVPAGTEVTAPLDGVIHSFNDNKGVGDYGPTIILEHQLDQFIFYTLYGHLSRESLSQLQVGQTVRKGELFATVGSMEVNGNWPTHLHFQIIDHMNDYQGDFPGVIARSEIQLYSKRCPDPNLILDLTF